MSIRSFRERTTLGRTSLEVSRLGIGSGYGVISPAELAAIDDGLRLVLGLGSLASRSRRDFRHPSEAN